MSELVKGTEQKTINILGTPYEIIEQSEKENPKLKDAVGICEQYSKKIVLSDWLSNPTDEMAVENPEEFRKKVLRHEIIHAFLGESGLRNESEWAENEEMVDWFANQFEKIHRAFREVGALENVPVVRWSDEESASFERLLGALKAIRPLIPRSEIERMEVDAE